MAMMRPSRTPTWRPQPVPQKRHTPLCQEMPSSDLRALAAAVTQLAVDAESGEIDKALIHRYFAGRAEASSFKVADAVLARTPAPTTYARIDLVEFAGAPALMEAELIEPELFLGATPEAAMNFARVLGGMV